MQQGLGASALAPQALQPCGVAPAPDFAAAAVEVLRRHVPDARLAPLVQQFRADLEHRLDTLEQARGDLALLRQQGHLVAGSVATFGLERLGQLAAQLADATDLPSAIALLPALQSSARSGLAQLHAQLQTDTR